jgi:predicted permease
VEAIGRLKPGLTIAQAQSRVDALVASLQKQFPDDYPSQLAWHVRLIPLNEAIVGNVRRSVLFLFGAVGLVLLIGCVNVANLLLARASARGREMAVRQALGAARKRLIWQLLTESLLLSLLGGLVGLTILFCTKNLLLQAVPDSLLRLNDLSINWTVLLFALGASLAAGGIFGVAPALHAGGLELNQMLKQEGRGSTGSGEQARTRRVLVVTEFALSLVLMVAAGLLLRSFWDLLNERLGFTPQNVMAVRSWLPIPNDPETDIYRTAAQEATFVREVLRRGKTLPGVKQIAMGDLAALPLGHNQNDLNPFPLIVEGHEISNDAPIVDASVVTPDYFDLLRMPLLRGRVFTELDDDKKPTLAVINEAFARTYFPNQNPLGKRLKQPPSGDPIVASHSWMTIVGVIADARTESLADANMPQLYMSLYQRRAKDLAIFVRGRLDTAAIPVDLREQVQSVNPELPVFGAQMLNEVVTDSLSESILQMILRQGLRLAISGAAVGLVGALIVSRLMAGLLYGVTPADPPTFGAVVFLLITVALLACYIPARRAIRVDPVAALKYE